MYDHEKIQRKMDKLEDLDNDDDLRMPGSTTSYKSINYKNQGNINGSSVASSVMTMSNYGTPDYADDAPPEPVRIEV